MIAELNGHARPADYAKAYHAAGLSPIAIRADASKAPAGAWGDYQRRQPTVDELSRMFLPSNVGVAICYGPASGNAELIDIDDVTFRQDPVQRLIGVGTIIISSSDRTDPELRLLGIQNARDVADTIDDARRRERRRRGLHIESV